MRTAVNIPWVISDHLMIDLVVLPTNSPVVNHCGVLFSWRTGNRFRNAIDEPIVSVIKNGMQTELRANNWGVISVWRDTKLSA